MEQTGRVVWSIVISSILMQIKPTAEKWIPIEAKHVKPAISLGDEECFYVHLITKKYLNLGDPISYCSSLHCHGTKAINVYLVTPED